MTKQNTAQFIRVLEDFGGSATTSQIRENVDLTKPQIEYQYKKLYKKGLIDIIYDGDLTHPREPPMKVATLTEDGRKEIEKGMIVEERQRLEKNITVKEVDEKVKQIQEIINHEIFPGLRMHSESIGLVEQTLEEHNVRVNKKLTKKKADEMNKRLNDYL